MKRSKVFFSKLLIVALLVSLLAPMGALATESEAVEPTTVDAEPVSETLAVEPEAAEESDEEPEIVSNPDADVETLEEEPVSEMPSATEVPAELEPVDAVSAMEESADETAVEEEVLDTETEVAEDTAMEEASSEPAAEGTENTFTVGQTIRVEESGSYTLQCNLGELDSKSYGFVLDAECESAGDSVDVLIHGGGYGPSGYSSMVSCYAGRDNHFICLTLDANETLVEITLSGEAVAELTVYDLSALPTKTMSGDTTLTLQEASLISMRTSDDCEYFLTGEGSGTVDLLSLSIYGGDRYSSDASMNLPFEDTKLVMNDSYCVYYLLVLPAEESNVTITLQEAKLPVYTPGTISIDGQSSAFVSISTPGFYTITSIDGYQAQVRYDTEYGYYYWGVAPMTTLNLDAGIIKIYNYGDKAGSFTVERSTATLISDITEKTDLKEGVLYSFSVEKDGTYVFMSDDAHFSGPLYQNNESKTYISKSSALDLTRGTYEFVLENSDVKGFYIDTVADVATAIELNQIQKLVMEETYGSTQAYYKVSVPADGYYALEYQGNSGRITGVWSENNGELDQSDSQFYYLQKGDTVYLRVVCYSYRGDDSQKSVSFVLSGPINSGNKLVLDTATGAKSGMPSNCYTFTVSEAGNYGFKVTGDYDSESSSFCIWDAEENLLYENLTLETALPLNKGSYMVFLSLTADEEELSVTLTKSEKKVVRSGEMTSVTWEQYNTGELVFTLKEGCETGEIESRADWYDVGEGEYTWYSTEVRSDLWSGFITEVTIPEGITAIGVAAFYGLSQLKEVKLPSTLKSIGALAFAESGLVSISLPNQLESLGCYAFADCASLAEVSFSPKLTVIAESAFLRCESLCSVNIPEGVKRIESNAFNSCTSLSEVELPKSVTALEYACFCYCDSLKTFTVPANVLTMDTALKRSGVEKVYVYADTCVFSNSAFGGWDIAENVWADEGYVLKTNIREQDGIVVYGNLNSKAQAYCEEMGYTFALLMETKEADIPTVDPEAEAGTAGVSSESFETASKVAEEATTGLLELLAAEGSESEEESSPLTETEQEINDNVIAITDAEALQKMKESKGSIQAAVVVNVVEEGSEASESSEEEQQKVQNALAELKQDDKENSVEVVQTLNISVNLVANYQDGEDTKTETVGQVKQSSETMTFSVVLSNEQVEALTGKNIYIMRVHDGAVTLIPAKLKDNILSFESDRFSTFSVISSTKELLSKVNMDMNGNGVVDTQDVIHLVRYILGLTNILHADGDTNSDSRTVGLADVIHLLREVMDSNTSYKSSERKSAMTG